MENKNNRLSVEKLREYAPALSEKLDLKVVAETGSTNTDLLERLTQLTRPQMLAAETQLAGRGRAGRSWLSSAGDSLTFSVAWGFSKSPHELLGLPLCVGVALAQALQILGVTVELKWPNDVLKNGEKLAGVLVESAVVNKTTWTVIGIGLNLRVPQQLEQQIGHKVADLTWLSQMDSNRILAVILETLVVFLEGFAKQGFSAYVESWNRWHAYQDQRVVIHDHGKMIQHGVACGVNGQGCLVLRTDEGVTVTVMVGDVSLRLE